MCTIQYKNIQETNIVEYKNITADTDLTHTHILEIHRA